MPLTGSKKTTTDMTIKPRAAQLPEIPIAARRQNL